MYIWIVNSILNCIIIQPCFLTLHINAKFCTNSNVCNIICFSETQLQITLHPSTGDVDEKKFVCLTLVSQISKAVSLFMLS